MNFKKINNLTGWAVFAIALMVYFMTMERTVSFWDCGEFIATAYKLQVGHSPGAPLFMILGRVFALFATSKEHVALMVNSMSALVSAITILMLFWSITHFGRKFFSKERYADDLTQGNLIAIMGAGVVGALAYTFSDTFWFSAVEAEVYATSSCFTAVVFWAILKWEDSCNEPRADRWLVLIAYLIGLSIGVHLLSLLVLPTIALVYYFKRYEVKLSGAIIAFLIGGVLLALVQYGVIQYVPIFATKFELLFVNSFGLPLNSGALFFLVLLAGLIAFLLIWSKKKNRYVVHLGVLCLAFVNIGYVFSYIPTIIRAKAGVSINMTNPDNVLALVPYLQREQYGAQPLLSGPDFDSRTSLSDAEPKPVYAAIEKDGKVRYEEVGSKREYTYDKTRVFPRIWDNNDDNHVKFYREYLGLGPNDEPTGGDNIRFFMQYQINWMFWRYFMWNYSGRQNDIEGQGEAIAGNWISGIKPLDKFLGKGDIDKLSPGYKNNKARNQMYLLPFAIGLIGLVYQFTRNKLDGWIVLSLFFLTGIAVQLYINNTPMQPRERDYQYVAAYPFAMWIGFGVLAIREWLQRIVKNATATAVLATLICLFAVPILMAAQEWDDHDRSQKTLAHDHAYNMLASCDSNAILITNGDNDTYPLWYIQEVEGFRKDVRILNYNLLGTDWQNAQMFKRVNNAAPIPVIWKATDFLGENLEITPFNADPRVPQNQYFPLEEVIHYITNPKNRAMSGDGKTRAFLPTKNFAQPLDKAALLKSGLVSAADSSYIPAEMQLQLSSSYATRAELSIMNIIAGVAKDGWRRPIYFANGIYPIGLQNYFQSEGLLNKVVPALRPSAVQGLPIMTNLDKNIELITKKFTLGGASGKNIYYDEKNKVMFIPYLLAAVDLANNLSFAERKADAIKVLDHILTQISETSYPYEMVIGYDRGSIPRIIDAYYRAGAQDKARALGNKMSKNLADLGRYYNDLSPNVKDGMVQVMYFSISNFAQAANSASQFNDTEMADKWFNEVEAIGATTPFADQLKGIRPAPRPQAKPQAAESAASKQQAAGVAQ